MALLGSKQNNFNAMDSMLSSAAGVFGTDCDVTDGSYPMIFLEKKFSEASVMEKYGVKPDAETLDIANTAARQKSITVVMKIYWGDPRDKICEAVDHIPLSSLGGLKRMIMGSFSNHVVNNVACPVTVVKSHH
ncbi:hypothetical protein Bca4012_066205 [Brassica carinata]|uniref:UspA domain-containing protein n=1 Tax=Brassica carinata TaxID=52824 RepID=A0A8X7VQP0_BRACI|nr:hypothetical protein Bca52824_018510 [Brassica carinata]